MSVASTLDLYMDESSDDEEKAEEATLKPWTSWHRSWVKCARQALARSWA